MFLSFIYEALTNNKENMYYHAKGLKEDSVDLSLETFHKLIDTANGDKDIEWIFKSYKQLAKIYYQRNQYESVLECIGSLIGLLPKLNGNYAEDSINKLLSRYSSSKNTAFVSKMYDVIVSNLQDAEVSGMSAHRLWLKININRLNSMLEHDELQKCPEIIRAINEKLENVSELTKTSYALDIIAAEIEYEMRSNGNINTLKLIYQRSLQVKPAITHPRVMGVIKECGAMLQFYAKKYDRARVEFYECFKHFDEAGSLSKNKVLKYLCLCSMLADNEVNPFESQETQVYTQLPEFQNLILLGKCYEQVDLKQFLSTVDSMNRSGDSLAQDPIFKSALPNILHNLKVKLILSYLKAYKTVRYDFVILKLSLADDTELENLLMSMANEGADPRMRIDFCLRTIETEDESSSIFPPSLNEKIVTDNFGVLRMLRFYIPNFASENNDAQMDIDGTLEDNSSPHWNLSKMLFFDAKAAHDWLLWLKSAIPAKAQHLVSQKDQIYSEQQDSTAIKQGPSDLVQTDASTNSGILGATTMHPTEPEEEEDEDEVSKIDLLQTWTQQLLDSLTDSG